MNENEKNQQNIKEQIALGFRLFSDENGKFNSQIYEQMSKFCNENGYDLKDCRPDYFEITEVSSLPPTILAFQARLQRDSRMNMILAKTDRYEKQIAVGLSTTDSAETYRQYLLYLEYLRKIPETAEFPNVKLLDFEAWNKQNNEVE